MPYNTGIYSVGIRLITVSHHVFSVYRVAWEFLFNLGVFRNKMLGFLQI